MGDAINVVVGRLVTQATPVPVTMTWLMEEMGTANQHTRRHQPSRLRRMSPEQSAYLGGLFDGDGSIYQQRGRYTVTIDNGNPELISAPLRFLGVGSVYPYMARGHLFMSWQLYRQAEVLDFLRQVYPYSAKAKGQMYRCLM